MAAMPVLAQSVSDGNITGTVATATGEVLPGATIKITSAALVAGVRTAVSGSEGRFVFLSLPPGRYDLSVSMQGFKTATETGLVLERGQSLDVPVHMEIGQFAETITVTSVTPIVDTRSSTVDTTFGEQLLAKIPSARNPFYDLALTAPGMSSVGAEETWLPSPSAYGSANSQNITLVNGVNTTNPRGSAWGTLVSVNYNTVEEVKVLSLGAKAEYGNYSGAAIDVITKSGGNEFHGDVAYYGYVGSASNNAPKSAGASWLKIDPSLDVTTDLKSNKEPSVTLGGPILRDQLWFYVGISNPKSSTGAPLRTLPDISNIKLYDGKLTSEFAVNHRAWLGLHYEDIKGENTTWGNGWDSSMVYNSKTKNFSPQFQYQWVATPTSILGVKYLAFNSEQTPWTSGATGHPGYINWWKWLPVRDMGTGGDFPYIEAQRSKRQTVQADFSHYTEKFLGEHDVKFGVQYTKAEGNYLGGYFQGYANFAYPYGWNYSWQAAKDWPWNNNAFWFNCSTQCWPIYNRKVETNPYLTVRKSDNTGVFADDTWVLNDNLTINLGLRWDKSTAGYGTGAIYQQFASQADIEHPTFLRDRGGAGTVYDFTTWSPRVGFAWTFTDDHKTVLRGHFGRYFAAMGVESLRRLGPDLDPFVQDTWLYFLPASVVDVNGNGMWDPAETPIAMRNIYGRTPDMNIGHSVTNNSFRMVVAPGVKSPYTDQFNVSLQHQLASDLAIEVTAIYKTEKNLLALQAYDLATGLPFEWEKQPFTTWTGYQTSIWQIALKDYNRDGVINASDVNYASSGDTRGWRTVNASSFAGQNIKRTYEGLQLVLNKRLANRWQGFAAINWSKTDGFYPRTVDQNWYIDGPLVMDTPFGSSMNNYQNNLSGPALMTPEWAVKLTGSYTVPVIETDVGLRVRYDSGRPIFPVQSVPTWASWMGYPVPAGAYVGVGWNDSMVAGDPDHPNWLPATTIFDINFGKGIGIGDAGKVWISFDVLNALNSSAANRVVYTSANYGLVSSVVWPRVYRAGIKFSF
jgi:outer membrane receptor protein involved in Fe transport